ncbi:MAG: glycosyltransferase family 2 protein [Ignavibacteria bacterium]|nr:glycosyltransferase family 2 protein [Ignavibacteria bacterium]
MSILQQAGLSKEPKISFVTAVYNSAVYLDEFIPECINIAKQINCPDFEIICVNDGSPDGSLAKLLEMKKKYLQIVIIDLSRNYGQHYALFAGITASTGDYIFLLDCDFETHPNVLIDFYGEIKNSAYDVVYGYQEHRKGGAFEKISGNIFWKIFNLLSETRVDKNIVIERVLTRKYADSLVSMGDKNLFLAGMMNWVGFEQKGMPVKKKKREGRSNYSLSKKISLAVNSITSFSPAPLKMIFYAGVMITLISLSFAFYLMVRKALYPEEIFLGWTSILVSISFSLGIITLCLGVIGIYLAKIFSQVQNRPLYLIKNIYR